MAKQDDVRTKLQTKVFAVIGKQVTLKSKSSPIYNDRSELESETSSESTITIVPYNIINNRQSHQPNGNLDEGEMQVAIPYDVTVNIDDELTIESEDWTIKEIERNYLPDNVVTIATIVRTHQ